jgi:hypothetical protein
MRLQRRGGCPGFLQSFPNVPTNLVPLLPHAASTHTASTHAAGSANTLSKHTQQARSASARSPQTSPKLCHLDRNPPGFTPPPKTLSSRPKPSRLHPSPKNSVISTEAFAASCEGAAERPAGVFALALALALAFAFALAVALALAFAFALVVALALAFPSVISKRREKPAARSLSKRLLSPKPTRTQVISAATGTLHTKILRAPKMVLAICGLRA